MGREGQEEGKETESKRKKERRMKRKNLISYMLIQVESRKMVQMNLVLRAGIEMQA